MTGGRIVEMESDHGRVHITYEAGEEQLHEVIATPEGPVISPIPHTVDYGDQQLFSVMAMSPDKPIRYVTLYDPTVYFVPPDSDDPTKAAVIDREGRTVIFEADSIRVRSTGPPQEAQD